MMGIGQKQKNIFHSVLLEDLVPEDHPLRRIRPLIDTERIRELCADFYCADNGRRHEVRRAAAAAGSS